MQNSISNDRLGCPACEKNPLAMIIKATSVTWRNKKKSHFNKILSLDLKISIFATALISFKCFIIYLAQSCESMFFFLIVSNLVHKALLEHSYSEVSFIISRLKTFYWTFCAYCAESLHQYLIKKFSFSGIILLDIQIHFCREWTAINQLLTKQSYIFLLKFTAE